MNETTRTHRQLAVMRAIDRARPPYEDEVKRRSDLADSEFSEAVRDLIDAGVIVRHRAPLGALLYPTLRAFA